jgi:hypothetical protein
MKRATRVYNIVYKLCGVLAVFILCFSLAAKAKAPAIL